MKAQGLAPSATKTTFWQRLRRLRDVLNDYATALESTPCDLLVERMHRLEEEVERLQSLPRQRSSEAGTIDLG